MFKDICCKFSCLPYVYRGLALLAVTFIVACSTIEQQSIKRVKKPLPTLTTPELKFLPEATINVGGKLQEEISLRLANHNNNVFAVAYTGEVLKTDGTKVIWRTTLKNKISSGVSINKKYVFVGLVGGFLQALDITNGDPIWQVKLSSEILSAALATDDLVVVHTLDGSLVAFNAHSGKQLWHFHTHHPELILRQTSVPVLSGNLVLSGLANGKLVALNANSGNVEWLQDISIPHGKNDLARMVDISSSPVIVNNHVYVCAYQGNIAALKLYSGEFIWSNEGSSISGLSVCNNSIYISMANGDVRSINATTGKIIWTQDALQGRILTKPIIYKNWLIVADDDGIIHALHKQTGSLVGRAMVKTNVASDPIVHEQKLYVYLNSGIIKTFLLQDNN